MLKRSPGSKISGLPSSTIALPEGSFLAGLDRGTVTLHGYGSGKMFVLSGEETALDGTPQESAARTQSTWLKWPLWFKQASSPRTWITPYFVCQKFCMKNLLVKIFLLQF